HNEVSNDHENTQESDLNGSNISVSGSQSGNDGGSQSNLTITGPDNTEISNEKDDQHQSNEKGPVEVKNLESEMIVSLKGKTLTFDSNAKNHNAVKWDFGDGTTSNLVA